MRTMKDSGIEWIGEIPESWDVCRVKNFYSNHKKIVGTNCNDYERLALTMQGVIKRSKNDNEGLQPERFEGYQILERNDIVFKLIDLQNISTSRVGLSPYTGIVSPAYIIISGKNTIQRYEYYYFYAMYLCRIFNDIGSDMVRSCLNASDVLNLPLLKLSNEEKKKIADFLDGKCAKIDELVQTEEKMIEELKAYKQSVITEAVTKGLDPAAPMKDSGVDWLGEQPVTWRHYRAKLLFAQRNTKGNAIELQLLSPTQNYGVIPQSKYEELSGMTAVKLNENVDIGLMKTVHRGDFCISLRSFQGGFEYSDYEGVVSPAYKVFYPRRELEYRFYKYLFKEKSFIGVINSCTISLRDGKNISFEDFGDIILPVPPLYEQKQIADYLDEECAKIDEIIALRTEQINQLKEYKKSLIYEYVTGKKEVV